MNKLIKKLLEPPADAEALRLTEYVLWEEMIQAHKDMRMTRGRYVPTNKSR